MNDGEMKFEAGHDRVATGIAGLDDILEGGFPRSRVYLLEGSPGTGKTTLSMQFLLTGKARGERGVYITLSETTEELTDVALSHGWSLEGIELQELSATQQMLQAQAQQTVFESSEVELAETTRALLDAVSRSNPSRVVLDSLSELRLLAGSSLRFRQQVLAIKQYFAMRHCTVLLLDDLTVQTEDRQLQSLAHGVLYLEQIPPDFGPDRRRLRIVKMRGMKYRQGYHDYTIRTGGMVVYPRLISAEHRTDVILEQLASGNPALDSLTGGGPLRGTSILLVGAAGTGKSTVSLQYGTAAARRGERVKIYLFDERRFTYVTRANGVGIQLSQHLDSGLISIQQVDPTELSPGEFTQSVRDSIEQGVRMIIIDSLDGFLAAMPGERFLLLQLHELLAYLGQHSIMTVMTLDQHGILPSYLMEKSADASYLADTVLSLCYYEYEGEIHRAISCIKNRAALHESTIRDLRITSKGLVIGEPLRGFRGILSGIPVRNDDHQTNGPTS
jgi:circadian clock protein KaiC